MARTSRAAPTGGGGRGGGGEVRGVDLDDARHLLNDDIVGERLSADFDFRLSSTISAIIVSMCTDRLSSRPPEQPTAQALLFDERCSSLEAGHKRGPPG